MHMKSENRLYLKTSAYILVGLKVVDSCQGFCKVPL